MPKFLFLLLCLGVQVQAQDTTRTLHSSAVAESTTLSDQQLIDPIDAAYVQPQQSHKMLFTQRIFWGPNGLLRVLNIAPSTPEGREKERKVRRFMMLSHQVTGYVTLAGFIMQGILEAKMNNATGATYSRLYDAQQTTMAITNIAYGTTALLSLTAPPKLVADRKKGSAIKLHKYLAIIHLTGFVATNILASKTARNPEFRPYHQAAAFTTFAAFAPALIALKF